MKSFILSANTAFKVLHLKASRGNEAGEISWIPAGVRSEKRNWWSFLKIDGDRSLHKTVEGFRRQQFKLRKALLET